MFLRNAWYIAAWSDELVGDRLLARRILGTAMVLYRGESGKVAALRDRCPHRSALLSMGQREGDGLRCMYHGLLFDGEGRCIHVPGQKFAPRSLTVSKFPTVERNQLVWIWPGDPELAREDDIPDFHWHDQSRNVVMGGYIRYAADYRLITDNLMDFSHLPFVHHNTLGSPSQVDTRSKVTMEEGGANIKFVTLAGQIPALGRDISELPDIVDRYQYFSWQIRSCVFTQESLMTLPGEPFEVDTPQSVRLKTINVLTPESETSTHFFWSIAFNEFKTSVTNVPERLKNLVGRAFEQDRLMIEGQQRAISDSPDEEMRAIPADAAVIQVRRKLDEMLRAEASEGEHLRGAVPA